MQLVHTLEMERFFEVLATTPRGQAALMVLEPGARTGGPHNRHPGADQWLFVVSGRGTARVAGRQLALSPGTLLLIEAGEAHEIDNTGIEPLHTLNLIHPAGVLTTVSASDTRRAAAAGAGRAPRPGRAGGRGR